MKQYRRLLYIALFVFSLWATACSRRLNMSTEKVVYKDRMVERIRDTTIYVEIEKTINTSVSLMVDTSILENSFSKSSAWVSDNLLYHNLEQKEQRLPTTIRWLDKYHFITKDSLVRETTIVEVNKLTKVQNFKIMLGNVFGGILLLVLVYFLFRGYKILHS